MRSQKLTAVLVVIGCLATLVAHVGWWSRFVVFDEDGFSRAVVRATDSEEVRRDLRGAIVEEVIEGAEPRLIAARPLLESAVDTVLGSDAFSRVIQAAAEDLHRSVFEAGEPTVTFQATQLVTRAQDLVRAVDPELAAAPGWDQAAQLPIASERYVLQARAVDRYVRLVTIVATLLAVTALTAALWLAPVRRRAITDIGIGIVAVSGIILAGSAVAGVEIERWAPDAWGEGAGSVFDVFTRNLRTSSLWLGAAGILAVAAAVARSPDHPAPSLLAPISIGRTFIEQRSRQLSPVARSVGLLVIGGAMIYWRSAFLSFLVIVMGAWVAFVGLYGILDLLGRYEGRKSRLPLSPRSVFVAFIALVAAVLGLGLLQSQAQGVASPIAGRACNGHESLCDRRVDQVVFATTHNSMAASEEPGWFSAYQRRGIPRQLQDGVRGFLLDTYYGRKGPGDSIFTDVQNPTDTTDERITEQDRARAEALRRQAGAATSASREVYLCHGFCELGATRFRDTLDDIGDFLDTHRNDVVVLFLQDEVPPPDVARVFADVGLDERVYTHQPGMPWPTLRELSDRRQQIIVMGENFAGPPAWYHAGFQLVEDTPHEYPTIESFDCRPNRGTPAAPLLLVNHWLVTVPPDPQAAARANAYSVLLNRAQTCAAQRGQPVNLLAVDFYTEGNLFEVVDVLNGVRPPRPGSSPPASNPT